MKLMPDDPRQALRCRRILMAVMAYGVWMVLGAVLHALGLIRIGVFDLALYCLAILFANFVFFLFVRTGLNRRFEDPSMTFVQIAVSILFAMWFVAVVEPPARGVTLLLFVSGLFFGVFQLRTREFLALASLAVGLYAALIIWEAQVIGFAGRDLNVAIAQGVVLGAVLLWLSFMGGYVARLRMELRKAVHRIDTLAHTDDLTGTENRRSITNALQEAMESAAQGGGDVAVCLLDVDHFKRVNDEHGHPVGDEVLKEFVQRIEETLRVADTIGRTGGSGALGRFGGEEFLVVLRETDESGGVRAGERIRSAIQDRPFNTSKGTVSMTVSGGVAGWRPGDTETDLLRRADRALYRAKREGRNRVAVSGDGETEAERSTPA